MIVTTEIMINKPRDSVWNAITDIEHFESMISSIIKINVLNKPSDSLVGLKWEETRIMFGKEAMETMWITDSVLNEYYFTRAESHGSIYITKHSLSENEKGTLLTMTFTGNAESFVAKLMSIVLSPLMKGSIKKCLSKDMEDIKAYVEKT